MIYLKWYALKDNKLIEDNDNIDPKPLDYKELEKFLKNFSYEKEDKVVPMHSGAGLLFPLDISGFEPLNLIVVSCTEGEEILMMTHDSPLIRDLGSAIGVNDTEAEPLEPITPPKKQKKAKKTKNSKAFEGLESLVFNNSKRIDLDALSSNRAIKLLTVKLESYFDWTNDRDKNLGIPECLLLKHQAGKKDRETK